MRTRYQESKNISKQAVKDALVCGAARSMGGVALQRNRVVISKSGPGELAQCFEQRGRQLTNEFATNACPLWEEIRLDRPDGALVRLTTPVRRGTDVAAAEQRMQDLLRTLYPKLSPYTLN